MQKLFILCLLSLFSGQILSGQTNLRITDNQENFSVQILESGSILLESPIEGLWSVGTSWSNAWPSDWQHIQADSMEQINGYLILHGSLHMKTGILKVRDAYITHNGQIKCTRRWEWAGADTLKEITLTVRFKSPGINKRVLMPGILYYGNPAGERSRNTPVFRGEKNEMAFFEEHRFPMPFVSREWGEEHQTQTVALHSLPSPIPFGNKNDQWWSIGIINHQESTDLCLYSGPVGFNGQKSVIKAFQGRDMMEKYDEAWINLPPGAIVEKTFYLEGFSRLEKGSGFQYAVESSLNIFRPWDMNGLPTFDEILQAKINFSESRYTEGEDYAGFRKYPDRNYFVLGWCGQAMAPGYAYQILGPRYSIDQPHKKIQKSLDFLSSTGFYESGFYTWYNPDKKEWFMNHRPEWLSQGQAMLNICNAIRVASGSDLNLDKWTEFLIQAADFHAARILSKDWKPESTNEGFFIAPLAHASKSLDNILYLKAAEKAANYYAKLYLDMTEVYWGGTLDASCEDKEGAYAALQGFIDLYEVTGKAEYLKWAKHAGDVCLTYTVVWDIPLPPGRLTDHNFRTRGWTAVSVQNMHIDVFGVLIAPYIYKLGKALNKDSYLKTAELMFRSCGQLIDPYGSQGEQPYQTNYIQTNWRDKPVYERRGNYLETWTVFWITAHFLNAGAMLMELGAI